MFQINIWCFPSKNLGRFSNERLWQRLPTAGQRRRGDATLRLGSQASPARLRGKSPRGRREGPATLLHRESGQGQGASGGRGKVTQGCWGIYL